MKKILITFVCVMLCGIGAVYAQIGFAKNKLYNVIPAGYVESVMGYKSGDDKAALQKQDVTDPLQQWLVSNLSGSFRFINPFENKAIHARTDNTLGITENNGSDESQLWTLRKKGEYVQIIPTNTPELIVAYREDGKLMQCNPYLLQTFSDGEEYGYRKGSRCQELSERYSWICRI